MAPPWEHGPEAVLGLVQPLMDQVELVSALPPVPQEDFPQAQQDMALHLDLPVSSPLPELDTQTWALLAHQEAPASVPFMDQETSASVWGTDSQPSALGHQEAIRDQVVHLEPQAPAREVELEPLALDWEEPPEAAALP